MSIFRFVECESYLESRDFWVDSEVGVIFFTRDNSHSSHCCEKCCEHFRQITERTKNVVNIAVIFNDN